MEKLVLTAEQKIVFLAALAEIYTQGFVTASNISTDIMLVAFQKQEVPMPEKLKSYEEIVKEVAERYCE
jgi:hypothetical protein